MNFQVAIVVVIFAAWRLFHGTKAMSITERPTKPPEQPPPADLSWEQIKDSKSNGVSFEANDSICVDYLREIMPDTKLEDLSRPGPHSLRIHYYDRIGVEPFLQCILGGGIHEESSWSFEFFKDWERRNLKLNQTTIMNFISSCPQVTHIEWTVSDQMPAPLFNYLEEYHPECRISYTLDFNGRIEQSSIDMNLQEEVETPTEGSSDASKKIPTEAPKTRGSLLGSKLLYSLTTEITYGGWEETARMDRLHRLLIECPNIKELSLTVYHSGCIVTRQPQPFAFDFKRYNDTLVPLEVLTLSGYRFDRKPNGLKWMEWEAANPSTNILYFPWSKMPQALIDKVGYEKIKDLGGLFAEFVKRDESPLKEGERTNLDYWLERMDWSKLHTLNIKRPKEYEFGRLSGNVLPRLRNVSFEHGPHTAIVSFLSSLEPKLEVVSLKRNCHCAPDNVLEIMYKQKGLKSLTLYHPQSYRRSYRRSYRYTQDRIQYPAHVYPNATHLSNLRHNCPILESLKINFHIGSEWNYDVLDALSEFMTLTSLTLVVETLNDGSSNTKYGEHPDVLIDIGYDDEDPVFIRDYGPTRKVGWGLSGYLKRVKKGSPFTTLAIDTGGRVVDYAK